MVIVRPNGYRFSDCFLEVADTVAYGLKSLGHDTRVVENDFRPQDAQIIFGSHLLSRKFPLPENSLLYNLEQIAGGNVGGMMELAKTHVVWDYAAPNVQEWKRIGVDAVHVPVGYSPEMTRIDPVDESIDVLFYGSMNGRRMAVISELFRKGLQVRIRVNDAYGSALDSLIARAKVILNLHYYESKIFEIVRVGYALANRKAVVSEKSVDDYPELSGGIECVPYNSLVDACVDLVKNSDKRRTLAKRGFELYSQMKEAEILEAALNDTFRHNRVSQPAH